MVSYKGKLVCYKAWQLLSLNYFLELITFSASNRFLEWSNMSSNTLELYGTRNIPGGLVFILTVR